MSAKFLTSEVKAWKKSHHIQSAAPSTRGDSLNRSIWEEKEYRHGARAGHIPHWTRTGYLEHLEP